jgi:hypothetical protein
MEQPRVNRRTFLTAAGAGVVCATKGPLQEAPLKTSSMKVLLWCWDSRMTWDDEPERIQTNMAASEIRFPYVKSSEAYLTGFRRLVDYCSKNDIWGIVIWGFLRDAHGGVTAARDLCLYARDRGVSIVPGVGLCAYGGYYYDGEHPFNLEVYLKKHPERVSIAQEEGGKRSVAGVLDPSLPENRQWWRDGLDWMLENFAIAGINYEMGDFIVNSSSSACAARAALNIDTDENIQDIVIATHDLMQYAHDVKPDGVFINALYRGYPQIKNVANIPYVKALHPSTVWQYTLTGMARETSFPEGLDVLPPHRQYGYLHWFNASTHTENRDYTADIARACRGAYNLGFEFIGTYGELKANSLLADRNYRAQVFWSKNPLLAYDKFI